MLRYHFCRRDDEDRKMEALIVIEEFCKELASIAHAKYIVEIEQQ